MLRVTVLQVTVLQVTVLRVPDVSGRGIDEDPGLAAAAHDQPPGEQREKDHGG